ncbi:GNAT family N-acetyltransferase [Streptomyces tendae]|uniref:GNAT family N-acetyltransferase n=1 Tax=Streptomyces tendae TaxID=1932 RepID=UPI0036C151EF
MASGNGLSVVTLSSAQARDTDLMTTVTALINDVYEVAEEGLWVEGTARTTVEEVAALTRAGEITTARLEGKIVGCIRVQQLSDQVCEFGMLATSFEQRGTGIGRELVQFAEQHAREIGREVMQLEVLVPREWAHPSKEFLIRWYTRIGYQIVRKGIIEESYPDLAPHLATPCDFVVYHKSV